ncbi:hypothetical protein ACL6C3_23905 [Capilliphycus salinus ALCB114379]|uniref:hypothetical protein n=1 Tax=Capilliphycus salinus TaxID=2768948 RepID=UPI0039A63D5C
MNYSFQQNYAQNTNLDIMYPATGTLAGVGLSATIGNMGLVGSFGGVAVGAFPVAVAGSVVGFAVYGATEALKNTDSDVIFPIATGAIIGAGMFGIVGGMGLGVAGTAVSIGGATMGVAGAVVGLGVYGAFKMVEKVDKMMPAETAMQAFSRMEERINDAYLDSFFYTEALLEVAELINPDLAWERKFRELEIEEELQQLKAQVKPLPQIEKINIQITVTGWYDWHPHLDIAPNSIKRELAKYLCIQMKHSEIQLMIWSIKEIAVQPSARNYLGKQYKSPSISKIVEFELKIALTLSVPADILASENFNDIVKKNLEIGELSSLVKVDKFALVQV